MNLIDTHCHLTHSRLRDQAVDALARAREAGVPRVIIAASDLPESKAALNLARQHEGAFCMCGVHPHEAAQPGGHYLQVLGDLAGRDVNVAIGEVGLDYHYEFSPRQAQQTVFAEQLDLARRLAKPIVVHTREAFDDTMAILQSSGVDASTVLMHSFTGGPNEARRVLDWGAWISYSGIATFKNAGDVRESVALTPADRLLVETDAPFLSPEPVRRMKTNEPANVVHVLARLADVRGVDPHELAARTTANAESFFRLP